MKIISGGQIGVDIAALRAAKAVGLETGGWMPKGFKTKIGNKPEYAELYGMVETASDKYPPRTGMNVLESDGTLRIAHTWNSPGEICTLKAIHGHNRPHLDIDYNCVEDWCKGNRIYLHGHVDADMYFTKYWIIDNDIYTLNVAGNADKTMEDNVTNFLSFVFLDPLIKDRTATVESV